jgi:membrane-bound serine protease (ClpP class)
VARPLVLNAAEDREKGFAAAHDRSDLLDQTGTAEMNLHPAGRALFNAQRINVISHGEFIEKGSTVKVIEVRGNRIVVKKV